MPETGGKKPAARKQYNDIAVMYDILAEGDDGMLWFRHNIEGILEKLPDGAKILDCSCGTGNHAIWLAKQDYEVHASDISEGMIETARKKAERAGVQITFFQSSWTELLEKSDERFDLVIIPGNSLSHLENLSMADDVFNTINKVLRPGGVLFFDIRNWEKTYEENSLETQEFSVSATDGNFEVIYSYEMPSWNETGKMHVDIRPEGTTEYERYSFDFLPVSYHQLRDAAIKAGFKKVERGYFPGKDYYHLIIS